MAPRIRQYEHVQRRAVCNPFVRRAEAYRSAVTRPIDSRDIHIHLKCLRLLAPAACCARAASGHAAAAPPSAASNSRRPMVTVIRPSRARCVKVTIPRHQCAVFTFKEGRMLVASTFGVGFALRSSVAMAKNTGKSPAAARAAKGHAAAAPPSSVMNSRRLMGCPQAEDHTLPYCEKSALCITAKSAARLPRWVRLGQTDHLLARLGHGAYDSVSGHPRNFFVAPQFVKALTHSNGRPAMARDLVSPLV